MATAELPEAPEAQSPSSSAVAVSGPGVTPVEHQDPQTKRILYIFPNFRSVSASVHLPPQTVKEKFVTASEDTFDYSAFVLPAIIAGVHDAERSTPEFGHGGTAYGRYLWHDFVSQSAENYCVEFIVPAATHEDTRYYTLGKGGFAKRSGYALSRLVITRTDSGKESFNYGEVVGAGLGAASQNLYYPAPERSASNTLDAYALNLGIDAATFMVREFWPDVNHILFHGDKPMQVPQ